MDPLQNSGPDQWNVINSVLAVYSCVLLALWSIWKLEPTQVINTVWKCPGIARSRFYFLSNIFDIFWHFPSYKVSSSTRWKVTLFTARNPFKHILSEWVARAPPSPLPQAASPRGPPPRGWPPPGPPLPAAPLPPASTPAEPPWPRPQLQLQDTSTPTPSPCSGPRDTRTSSSPPPTLSSSSE